jgi:DNA-binding NarL/FixJ family response regulator
MNAFNKHTVFIVDEDEIIRESYAYIIGGSDKFIVAGSYGTAEDAIKQISKKKAEIIVMDIELPVMSGVEAVQTIKKKFPLVDILIVSAHDDRDRVFDALRAGVSGYIAKSSNYLEIISALDEIKRGGTPISGKIATMLVRSLHLNLHSPLTMRERQVLKLISEGKTHTQISDQLFISKETTKCHTRNIYRKLRVKRKSEAIGQAHLNRLI